MTTNKAIENLENAINKKQLAISYCDNRIDDAKFVIQNYTEAKAKEEKEIADLKKQQETIRNHKPGQLAKVSIYEFVNDWLRPEVSFQIFKYVAKDTHTKGVELAQKRRRKYCRYWKRWENQNPDDYHSRRNPDWDEVSDDRTPYTHLRLYRDINDHRDIHGGDDHYRRTIQFWTMNGEHNTLNRLKHVNPLLRELWNFHMSVRNGTNDKRRYLIKKGDIKKYLTTNKLKGRGDLLYGVKCSGSGLNGVEDFYRDPITNRWKPPEDRRELVSALMKME